MPKIYISLDLETTGFDAANDQVIEIAAIKFEGKNILEKFETLINPEVEIPAMVSHITGIKAEQVQDAPTFDQVSPDLIKFLGNHPIVGHNINFDLTFLEAKGIPIFNKQIDTLQLASILLPNLPSYSLDTISRLLKLEHTQKHRAMSDAAVCYQLFHLLADKIAEIPSKTLKEIQDQINKLDWDLGELFFSTTNTPRRILKNKTPKHTEEPKNTIPQPKSTEELLELLNSNSPIKTILPNFENRPSQHQLLDQILEAFQRNFHLIAEAGTGTGKTLAYLLAAAYQASTTQEKIIISTHTNTLQDQIINKDFELIHHIFPQLKITTLKGRKKYLSLSRFNQLKKKEHLEEHELTTIIKTLIWLNHTLDGDLDTLNLQNKEITLIDEICSTFEHHPEKTTEPIDFLNQARLKAENSDIIVVNHALLIQDSLSLNKILPQSHFLIIDEAHHLEKTTTDALTLSFSMGRSIKPIEHLEELLLSLQKETPLLNTDLTTILHELRHFRHNLTTQGEAIFEKIRYMLDKFAKPQNGQASVLSLTFAYRNSPEWLAISSSISDLKTLHDQYREQQIKIQKFLSKYDSPQISEIQNQLIAYIEYLHNFYLIPQALEEKIIWMSKGFDENILLQSAPLSVTSSIKSNLFDYKKSIILTSATLTTFGNFKYLRSELGLDDNFNEIKLPSHFNYPDQVRIVIPEDLPEPKENQYLEDCKDVILNTIPANQGRTLVLFTAKKDLSKVFHDLAPQLKKDGYHLLGQGLSGGRGKIISHFQDEPNKCAILGTNSFWEGVDLAGDLLTCVIIQKLPFDPPDDPIIHARSQKFRNPFEEYSLPRAILRFKQGFGRLIRSANDTGTVIILDSRLVQKKYGRDFISSLPEGIQIKQCSKKDTIQHLLPHSP